MLLSHECYDIEAAPRDPRAPARPRRRGGRRARRRAGLRAHRRRGGRAARRAGALATGARGALRHDAVGDRTARVRPPGAPNGHAAPRGRRARLRAGRRAPAANEDEGGHMTTTRTDIEEIGTTRAEKILALVLTAFLLIGGIWTYTRIDDWTHSSGGASFVQLPEIRRATEAQDRLARAEDRLSAAQQ